MNPIFEHSVFDSAMQKMKSHRNPLKIHCKLVSNVGATMLFLLQNRSDLLARERLYSTSAEIATTNGETDHATDFAIINHKGCP